MIFPIRCFTCGKVLASLRTRYEKMMSEKKCTQTEILDKLHVIRSCCRTVMITHIPLDEKKLAYEYIRETERTKFKD